MEKDLRSSSDPRLVRENSNASSANSARHSYDAKSEDGLARPVYTSSTSSDHIITEPSPSQDHDLGHIPPPSSHLSLAHAPSRPDSVRPPHSSAHIHRTRARSPTSTAAQDSNGVSISGEYSQNSTYDPDAPSAYTEKKYEKMSWEEEKRMRKRDYAIEISRIMGKQLVKTLKPAGATAAG